MQIKFLSAAVKDQDHALHFYTIAGVFEDTGGNPINLVQPLK